MRITGLLPPGAGSNKERLRHLNGGDENNQMSPFAKFVNFSLIAAAAYSVITARPTAEHVTATKAKVVAGWSRLDDCRLCNRLTKMRACFPRAQ
jgi:hypothetical protein